ncbi:MAG: hypothetical protein ACPGXK_00920 [Phycisphaerae bacterium]
MCRQWRVILMRPILVGVLLCSPFANGDPLDVAQASDAFHPAPSSEPLSSESEASESEASESEASESEDSIAGEATYDSPRSPFWSPEPIDWEEVLGKELGSNLRLTLDLSSRVVYNARTGHAASLNFIGFDLHKVISDADGDWGTLTLQGYTTNINNLNPHPPFFEDDDDWDFVPRIFDFNFTRLARGRFNIRVGHFELPYGLEQIINTNGTLYDFVHGRNLGVKADWGVTVNGVIENIEYEVALTRGSGIEYSGRGSPWIVSGRIGSSRYENFIVGASFMHGEVQSPMGLRTWRSGLKLPSRVDRVLGRTTSQPNRGNEGVIRRTRAGMDFQWYLGPLGLFGEFSAGRDFNQDVFNALGELNWRSDDDALFLYSQMLVFAQRFGRGWDNALQSKTGMRWMLDNHWALSLQYIQDLATFEGGKHNRLVEMQVRYRF